MIVTDINGFAFTSHSVERYKQRFGCHGENRICHQMAVDLRRGFGIENFSGRERRWMESRIRNGFRVIISGEKCLIVSTSGKVVTIYKLPGWFNRNPSMFCGKQRIRNPKTFFKLNPNNYRDIA